MLQSIVIGWRPSLTFNEYLCPGSKQTVPQLKWLYIQRWRCPHIFFYYIKCSVDNKLVQMTMVVSLEGE
jgi:hypothetical protein